MRRSEENLQKLTISLRYLVPRQRTKVDRTEYMLYTEPSCSSLQNPLSCMLHNLPWGELMVIWKVAVSWKNIFAGKTWLSIAICLFSGDSVDIMRWHLPPAGHWLASVCAHSKLLLDFLFLLLFRFVKDHRKFKNHYINAKSLKKNKFCIVTE